MITGSSSGLGEQLAHSFYKRGCKLILAARRVSELERVKNQLLDLVVVSTGKFYLYHSFYLFIIIKLLRIYAFRRMFPHMNLL